MVELFKAYETDFSKFLSSANKKIAALAQGKNGDLSEDVARDVKNAENLLRQMEKQIYSLAPQLSGQYQKRIQRYNESVRSLKRSLEDEQSKKGKVELFGKNGNDQREKLVSGNEILRGNGDILENSLKIGVESEQIAFDTVGNLKKQRTQIININDKVHDIGYGITKANRTITIMDRRRIMTKLTMIGIVVLLAITLAFSLYIKLG